MSGTNTRRIPSKPTIRDEGGVSQQVKAANKELIAFARNAVDGLGIHFYPSLRMGSSTDSAVFYPTDFKEDGSAAVRYGFAFTWEDGDYWKPEDRFGRVTNEGRSGTRTLIVESRNDEPFAALSELVAAIKAKISEIATSRRVYIERRSTWENS